MKANSEMTKDQALALLEKLRNGKNQCKKITGDINGLIAFVEGVECRPVVSEWDFPSDDNPPKPMTLKIYNQPKD